MAWPITAVAAAACGKPAFANAGVAAMAPILIKRSKVSHESVGMTAKLTAMMQNCVNKAGSTPLPSAWSHLLYADIANLCSNFLKNIESRSFNKLMYQNECFRRWPCYTSRSTVFGPRAHPFLLGCLTILSNCEGAR